MELCEAHRLQHADSLLGAWLERRGLAN
jgi:hypothetical protein